MGAGLQWRMCCDGCGSAVAVERHPDGSSKGLAFVRMRDGAVATAALALTGPPSPSVCLSASHSLALSLSPPPPSLSQVPEGTQEFERLLALRFRRGIGNPKHLLPGVNCMNEPETLERFSCEIRSGHSAAVEVGMS